jgi:hypothetical protein
MLHGFAGTILVETPSPLRAPLETTVRLLAAGPAIRCSYLPGVRRSADNFRNPAPDTSRFGGGHFFDLSERY